jgi:O-antigen/teichoic acid export membrane protein
MDTFRLNIHQKKQTFLKRQAGLLSGEERKSFVFTFVIEFAILIGGLFTLRLTAYLLGTAGFGEYAVARRAINILTFPLLFGLGISLPRYIALSGAGNVETTRHRSYFFAGLAIAAPIILVFGALMLSFPSFFAQLFFGSSTFSYLTLPILLTTIGLYLHTLLYAYFRGHMRMWRANLLQLSNAGVIPPVAVLLSGRKASNSLTLTGLGWIVISVVVFGLIFFHIGIKGLTITILRRSIRDLVAYGLPRVPGEFALFGLFAVPTFIIANRLGVERAGFFSFGLSLIQLISSMFAAVGILLLPYVSHLAAERRWDLIKSIVAKILGISLAITILIVVALQATLVIIISSFMGPSFMAAVGQSRLFLIAAIPYLVYVILRNPLDALAKWPYNSINLAFVLISATGLIWFEAASPPVIMLLALLLLSLLSLFSWRRSLIRARINSTSRRDFIFSEPVHGE